MQWHLSLIFSECGATGSRVPMATGRTLLRDVVPVGLGLLFAVALFRFSPLKTFLALGRSGEPDSVFPTLPTTKLGIVRRVAIEDPDPERRKLLYVGVISAGKFLNTRIAACNNTWGQNVPRDNIQYFVGTAPEERYPGVNIVTLPGSSDQEYPPQRKAFLMLKHMCEHHLDQFSWFLRADDDAYFHMERLEGWLRYRDPNQRYYIGQAGYGRAHDKGRLQLGEANFCMGGPGVIFSRALMEGLCPHLDDCMNNDITRQTGEEDVEIGRCVYEKLRIRCTSAYEFMNLFLHAYPAEYVSHPYIEDYEAESGKKIRLKLQHALTVHHVKIPHVMFMLHNYFVSGQRGSWRGATGGFIEEMKAMREEDVMRNTLLATKDPTMITLQDVPTSLVAGKAADMASPTKRAEKEPTASESEVTDWIYADASNTIDLSMPAKPTHPEKNLLWTLDFAAYGGIAQQLAGRNSLSYVDVKRALTNMSPAFGVRHLIEVLVRNDSVPASKQLLTYQLGCLRPFEEPEMASTNIVPPTESELIIILPLAPVHYPFFQRFMQMYISKFVAEQANSMDDVRMKVHLYVISFPASPDLSKFQENVEPLDPALVVSLYQSKYTHVRMRIVPALEPYSPLKALELGLLSSDQDTEWISLPKSVMFLASVELDVSPGFATDCIASVVGKQTVFFPVLSLSAAPAVAQDAKVGAGNSDGSSKEVSNSWLMSSFSHMCASPSLLSSLLKQVNTTAASTKDFYTLLSHRPDVVPDPVNVFRLFESGLKIHWDNLHSRCLALVEQIGADRAAEIFPSCSYG